MVKRAAVQTLVVGAEGLERPFKGSFLGRGTRGGLQAAPDERADALADEVTYLLGRKRTQIAPGAHRLRRDLGVVPLQLKDGVECTVALFSEKDGLTTTWPQ